MASVITKLLFFLFLWYSLICLASSVRNDYFISNQDLDMINSEKEVSEFFQAWKQKGIHFEALQYVLKNGGIATERDYPYNASNGVCNYTLETNNKFATIDGYNYWWNSSIPENSLFCAVAKQPISVSFSADQDFMSYTSGIFDGANFTSYVPCGHNHAMLIVGYGSLGVDKDYWTVKNSWGTSWGQCGYVLIKRNTGMARGVNNINCAGSYPTKQIK
ncbi:hypothetical protein K1719_046839 [Acacia pycnantha]|nr:hypothetical protein K1719_046839 [Acacia pycnantha]